MPHEIDRLWATPTMRPRFPARRDMLPGTLPALTVLALRAIGLRLSAAMPGSASACLTASAVAARAVALWLPSTGVPGTEAIVPVAGRLADGEIGGGPRGGRRAFEARQRGANQRPVHRALVVCRTSLGIVRGRLRGGQVSG